MDAAELILAVAGSSVLSGAGASVVTAIVGRRMRKAQVGQITAEAHKQIYGAYGELLDELRAELTAARGEVSRLRSELAESRARGEQVAAEMSQMRHRLDAAEQREAALTAEVTRLGGTLP
ncbi:hypothetical protein [Glycomyces tarimensis]